MAVTRLALLMLLAAGCKERGTQTISLAGLPAECAAATHMSIHLVRDLACPAAPCEAIARCTDDNCTPVCDGLCLVDELAGGGLRIVPPSAGLYAVVVQLVAVGDGGLPIVLCAACGQAQLDADGTSSSEITASGASCAAPPPPVDAGAVD